LNQTALLRFIAATAIANSGKAAGQQAAASANARCTGATGAAHPAAIQSLNCRLSRKTSRCFYAKTATGRKKIVRAIIHLLQYKKFPGYARKFLFY